MESNQGEADDGGNMLQGHTTAAAQAEGPKGDGSKMENGTSSISTQPVQAKTPDGQNQEAVDCLSSPPEPASARAAPNTQYLFLSHNFIHSKLKSFNPPCSIEVQLETDGEGQNSVHQGMLCDSASKGYYCLTAPPRELLLGKEIYGLRLRADGRIILQLRDRSKPLQVDEGRRRLNPRVIGITTSIRVDFLKSCFATIEEPRHPINIKVEVNGVRQPELFTGASISHNRQGSYYVLGLPFALVHGREFVAWRQIDPSTLELAVQDIDPAMAAAAQAAAARQGDASTASIFSGRRQNTAGIVVDSRISIPLAMLKRDLAPHLDTLLPQGMGPAFDIPIKVQYRLDGKVLPRVYEHAVIKKSEHRGCCYLNGTERIPVKGKVLVGLNLNPAAHLCILEFKSPEHDQDTIRRNSPSIPMSRTLPTVSIDSAKRSTRLPVSSVSTYGAAPAVSMGTPAAVYDTGDGRPLHAIPHVPIVPPGPMVGVIGEDHLPLPSVIKVQVPDSTGTTPRAHPVDTSVYVPGSTARSRLFSATASNQHNNQFALGADGDSEHPTPRAHPFTATAPGAGPPPPVVLSVPPPPVVVSPRAILQNSSLAPVAVCKQEASASGATNQLQGGGIDGLFGAAHLGGAAAFANGTPLSRAGRVGAGRGAGKGMEEDEEEEDGARANGRAQRRPRRRYDDDSFYAQQSSDDEEGSAKRPRRSGTGAGAAVAGRAPGQRTPMSSTRVQNLGPAAGNSRLRRNSSAAAAAAAAADEDYQDEEEEYEGAQPLRTGPRVRGGSGYGARTSGVGRFRRGGDGHDHDEDEEGVDDDDDHEVPTWATKKKRTRGPLSGRPTASARARRGDSLLGRGRGGGGDGGSASGGGGDAASFDELVQVAASQLTAAAGGSRRDRGRSGGANELATPMSVARPAANSFAPGPQGGRGSHRQLTYARGSRGNNIRRGRQDDDEMEDGDDHPVEEEDEEQQEGEEEEETDAGDPSLAAGGLLGAGALGLGALGMGLTTAQQQQASLLQLMQLQQAQMQLALSQQQGLTPWGALGAGAAATQLGGAGAGASTGGKKGKKGGTGQGGGGVGGPQQPSASAGMGGLLSMQGLPLSSMAPAMMGPDPLIAQQIVATQQMIAAQQMQLAAANPLMAAGMLGGMGALGPLGFNPLAAQLQMQAAAGLAAAAQSPTAAAGLLGNTSTGVASRKGSGAGASTGGNSNGTPRKSSSAAAARALAGAGGGPKSKVKAEAAGEEGHEEEGEESHQGSGEQQHDGGDGHQGGEEGEDDAAAASEHKQEQVSGEPLGALAVLAAAGAEQAAQTEEGADEADPHHQSEQRRHEDQGQVEEEAGGPAAAGMLQSGDAGDDGIAALPLEQGGLISGAAAVPLVGGLGFMDPMAAAAAASLGMGVGVLSAGASPLVPISLMPLPTIQEAIPAVPIIPDLVKGEVQEHAAEEGQGEGAEPQE